MIESMPKVLIVEDDEVIADGMARHLRAAAFDPVWVGNGRTALARLRYEGADVCVLDLMLPELDGWGVIESARRDGIGLPIVVVSARGSELDRVRTLELGADDYLVKPFSMDELVARVRAAARRGARALVATRAESIEVDGLRIEPAVVQAFVDGNSVELTPTEFRLLHMLALERGRVVTRDELLQALWVAGTRIATARWTSSCESSATSSTVARHGGRSSRRGTAWATASSRRSENRFGSRALR